MWKTYMQWQDCLGLIEVVRGLGLTKSVEISNELFDGYLVVWRCLTCSNRLLLLTLIFGLTGSESLVLASVCCDPRQVMFMG